MVALVNGGGDDGDRPVITTDASSSTTTTSTTTTTTVTNTTTITTIAVAGDRSPVCDGWDEYDSPDWEPDKQETGRNEGWRAGDLTGFGQAQYNRGISNFAYASEEGGWNQEESIARWDLGDRSGSHLIDAYIPSNHATARVTYRIYVGGKLEESVEVIQETRENLTSVSLKPEYEDENWLPLTAELHTGTDSKRISVVLKYEDSDQGPNKPGAAGRSVAIDAIRIRTCPANP